MGVEGTASEQEIIKAVADAGYGASKKGEGAAKTQSSSASAGEDMLKRQNDTGIKEASDCITWIPDRPDVFLHGSYDVGMAGSGIYER